MNRRSVLFFNSANRSGGSNENFEYVLPTVIPKVKAIKLKRVVIPLTYYPINSNNNSIYWTDGNSVTHTTTITSQDYNATELATAIQTALNSDKDAGDSNTYAVSYDAQTMKYTFNLSSGSSNYEFNTTNAQFTMASVLGFNTDVDKTGSTLYTGDNVVSIGSDVLYLASKKLGCYIEGDEFHMDATTNYNIYACIPITDDISSVQVFNDDENIFKCNDNQKIQKFDFQLLDDTFKQVDLNGSNWIIEIHIYHE